MSEGDGNHAPICNALADAESRIKPGIDPMLAMLAAVLHRAGGKLIPPLLPGGHTRIILADGSQLSLTAYLERARWCVIAQACCVECGQSMAMPPAGVRRRRGPRIDRRYCSNPCRQRAYRERKGATA